MKPAFARFIIFIYLILIISSCTYSPSSYFPVPDIPTHTPNLKSSPVPTTETPIPLKTTFQSPVEDQHVPWQVECRGKLSGSLGGADLWLVVVQNNTYHPQANGSVSVGEDYSWRAPCTFGAGPDENIGENFKLLAVLADSDVSLLFDTYLQLSSAGNNYPGLHRLPVHAVILGEVKDIVRE
jgi:hypothetical protein